MNNPGSFVPKGTTIVFQLAPNLLEELLVRSIKAEILFLRIVLRSIDDEISCQLGRAIDDPNFIPLNTRGAGSPDDLRRQAIRSTTVSLFRYFIQFMDDALALKEMNGKEHLVDRDLSSEEQKADYLLEMVSRESHRIGARPRYHSPQKFKDLVGEGHPMQAMVEGMLHLRTTLEHHRALAQSDFCFFVSAASWDLDCGPFGDLELGEPCFSISTLHMAFAKGERVQLTEAHVEFIAKEFALVLGPCITQGRSFRR